MDVGSSTAAKLRATIQLTRELSSGDFPHLHARDALIHIGKIFEAGLSKIEHLGAGTDPEIVRALCAAESRKIFQLYPLLGFLVRSTDVRNAFEIHGPFLRIVRSVLGSGSKLVLSSEWDFSPFTFLTPSEFALTDTVLIGVPASEASNVLIVPLSGHELGHNVWAKQKLREKFGPGLAATIVNHIAKDRWGEFSAQFPHVKSPDLLSDLVGQQSWLPAWHWGIRQCEELFCDFVGLSIFRESFLHASSYLLSPGLPQSRLNNYPGSKQRASAHGAASKAMGVIVPDDYVDRFDDESEPTEQPHKLLLSIADESRSRLLGQLIAEAQSVISAAGLRSASTEEIARIAKCFAQCVPAQHSPSLPSVISAAWDFYLSGMTEWRQMYPNIANEPSRLFEMLCDLALKAVEVFEIEQRQAS